MESFTGLNFRGVSSMKVFAVILSRYIGQGAYILQLIIVNYSAYLIMSYRYVRIDSCIRGFHEYKAIWDPTLGEELDCSREMDNPNDPYAVSVSKGTEIVGHVPRKISCLLLVWKKLVLLCTVVHFRPANFYW